MNDGVLKRLCERLVGEMSGDDHWEGRLSSSALATSTASFALFSTGRPECLAAAERGLEWLVSNINDDGGWGDTPESPSNATATLLAWCALSAADNSEIIPVAAENSLARAETWLKKWIEISPNREIDGTALASAVLKLYGDDRTFSVPILTMCAIAGKLGSSVDKPWSLIPRLPFELSLAFPSFLAFVGAPVVSYAMPALIAMGVIAHKHNPTPWSCLRGIRALCVKPALKRLAEIQPSNGSFLEAAPLTSFVLMGLVSSGFGESSVAAKCADYLLAQQRGDGSLPIDANLAVWLTTLSVNAFPKGSLSQEQSRGIRGWLLERQFKERHPFTNAAPGGWGWTHLPGAVPDADDTAGALLALRRLDDGGVEVGEAAERGVEWLLGLRNDDGGFPTFCKGWGKLPFDRSSPDITAHVIRALVAWRDSFESGISGRISAAIAESSRYLEGTQRRDGSWIPLWFGSQHSTDQSNPVFGTAKVALALLETSEDSPDDDGNAAMLANALRFLRYSRNDDGGWGAEKGAASTIEETSLAITALSRDAESTDFASSGRRWLENELAEIGDEDIPASPIGLYFASLWYSEKLYPLIFAVEALGTGETENR